MSVPFIVRVDDFLVPVVLDQVLKILPVSWSGVWDVVIREPTLKFTFMPFVVDYLAVSLISNLSPGILGVVQYIPALLNQVLATDVSAASAKTSTDRENFMMDV